jgi:hypothetical protein
VHQGHIAREERPQRGRENLTNVLHIVSAEWLTWIMRGSIGCKEYTATRSIKEESRELRPSDRRIRRMNR